MQATYCEIELDKAKRDAFVYAIKNHYWYQMYIDDLPIWGMDLSFLTCIRKKNVFNALKSVIANLVDQRLMQCSQCTQARPVLLVGVFFTHAAGFTWSTCSTCFYSR